MPLSHQIILGVIVAGFIFYPALLLWVWMWTKGWEYGPMGAPADEPHAKVELDPGQGADVRKAA